MSYSKLRARAPGPIPKELLVSIAGDLQGVTDRITELKELCEWQLNDLADSALIAANIPEWLASGDGIGGNAVVGSRPAEVDPIFLSLIEEMSSLHARLDAQIATGREIAHEFLAVACAVERELALVKSHGEAGAKAAVDGSVVSLQERRMARSGAAEIHQRARELSLSLRVLQGSVATLFQAQAQTGEDVASLRRRMQEYRRHRQPGRF